MNQLITITTNAQGVQVVSARELHGYLENGRQFVDWIRQRIEKYGFIENQDYTTFSQLSEKGRPTLEFALTLDMAKELAMVEANDKGKQARQFFIESEKQLRQAPALTQIDLIIQSAQQIQRQERELAEVKAAHAELTETVRVLDARTTTRPDYFTVAGYANLNRISIGLKVASSVGQRATRICRERGLMMETTPDPRFGQVNMYPTTVLAEVFSRPL